jgi:hypothetical protein
LSLRWLYIDRRLQYRLCSAWGLQAEPDTLTSHVAYAKVSLKKYRPIAARNEEANVSRGLL